MKFEDYHPIINILFFASILYFTICFDHPVFIFISYFASFIYSVKLNKKKSLVFNILLFPFSVACSLLYSSYTHFGVSVITTNFIGNMITLESMVYGLVIGFTISCVIMWLSCFFTVMSSDKIIYLFGRICPKFSLFISMFLRIIPQIKNRRDVIDISQISMGKGRKQGNFLIRIKNIFRQLSILTTWSMENLLIKSSSMKSRGYSLRGRSAYSIYRFDNRDRLVIIVMFFFLTIIFMGVAFKQVSIQYDPEIIINNITIVSFVFYFAYMLFAFIPIALEVMGDIAAANAKLKLK